MLSQKPTKGFWKDTITAGPNQEWFDRVCDAIKHDDVDSFMALFPTAQDVHDGDEVLCGHWTTWLLNTAAGVGKKAPDQPSYKCLMWLLGLNATADEDIIRLIDTNKAKTKNKKDRILVNGMLCIALGKGCLSKKRKLIESISSKGAIQPPPIFETPPDAKPKVPSTWEVFVPPPEGDMDSVSPMGRMGVGLGFDHPVKPPPDFNNE